MSEPFPEPIEEPAAAHGLPHPWQGSWRRVGLHWDATRSLALLCALVLHLLGMALLTHFSFGRGGGDGDVVFSVDVAKLLPPRFAERSPEPVATKPTETRPQLSAPAAPAAMAPAPLTEPIAPLAPTPLDAETAPEKTTLDAAGGDKFVGFVKDLRQRGMDVVFVFDSTQSMSDVIEEVKRNVRRMMAVLYALVPECRIGVVTYRDKGSAYVTRRRGLTLDRDAVLAFVNSIEVGIGRNAWNVEDWPEAVCQGLADAVHSDWRAQAHKAVIVIGDAPPPEDEEARTLRLAARFRIQQRGIVHTVYIHTISGVNMKASPGQRFNAQTAAAKAQRYSASVQKFFRKLGRAGGGEAIQLTAGDEVVRHLLTLAFGVRWTGDIAKIYQRAGVE